MLSCLSRLFWGLVLGLLAGGTGCRGDTVARSTAHFPSETGFVSRQLIIDGTPTTLWMFIPRDYNPSKKYPAIIFLHGLFEAGHGDNKVLSAGLGPVIARSPDDWQFITLFPQSDGTWRGEKREKLVIAALEHAERNWSIDTDRVILAGLSYGALGTWEIGARHADRFAALVPVSGHRATELVERLIMLPIWAFHFTGDMIVDPKSSEDMCRKIDESGGKAKLTEFTGVGHDCWDRAVDESNLVSWMLQQRRGQQQSASITEPAH